ncbi:MAG: BlaI/MecI/CopY family transcriptional regulator [Gemmatimonadaceae bacterium]|nr:BlaI/MecI/CopY family transcriptional regulator [Gemmatimonadaceae bacterium]
MPDFRVLSRRERQIMDFLYQRGHATAAEVQAGIEDAPGYSAVRALLRTLEEKGMAMHTEEGRAYVFRPTVSRDQARTSALSHLVTTFFGGSREQAVAALLDPDGPGLSKDALERMARLVEAARAEGR